MMAQLFCCLCNDEVITPEFDLQKTLTSNSQKPLSVLIQSCIDEECFITNYLICKMCYLLLNELDIIKLRMKAIEDKLKNYLCKYYKNNTVQRIQNVVNVVTAEYTDCFKNDNSKDLEEVALKEDHTDANELKPKPKIDAEMIPIAEINSSLDHCIWLNEEQIPVKENEKQVCKNNFRDEKEKTSDKLKPYACTECPKTWNTLAKLKSHQASHSTEKPYICEICGQAYKRQQALIIHVGMHKGINPYTCVYCKKSFTQKAALVRHTPIHTGQWPFQCDLCGKRFVHHTSFNIHKLIHTGEKSYKCEHCGLLLLSGSHLKRHMKVHTGEKRFICGTCGKKFAERYNLAVHEKLHLGVSKKKKYQCHICGNIYGGQVILQEHIFNMHQKQYAHTSEVV